MQTKISIKSIIQSLQKQLENKKFFLKLIKGIYKISIANILPNDERLNVFFQNPMFVHEESIQQCTGGLNHDE